MPGPIEVAIPMGKWLKGVVRRLAGPESRAELARSHRENGDLDSAEDLLRRGLAACPGDLALMTEFAQVASAREDWVAAAIRWNELLENHGERAPAGAFIRFSQACRAQGALTRAEGIVNRGLETYASHPHLLRESARVAMALEDWPTALSRWENVSNTKIGHGSEVQAALVRAHRNLGNIDEAEAILQAALKKFHRNVPLLAESAVLENYRTLAREVKKASRHPVRPRAEIVVCVHNALDETRTCLEALNAKTHIEHFVTVVDDASEPQVHSYLQHFAAQTPHSRLLVNTTNQGYTRSANRGLEAARADWVVLLNSDTIVTDSWLEGLLDCALSDPAIRAAGPLSNAATFQSIPGKATQLGNERCYTERESLNQMASEIRKLSWAACPRVPMLNGFCLMLHKPTLDVIGYLDETNFPLGYGEENDLCLRLLTSGYKLAIADFVYVYHSQSASFGLSKKRQLTANAVEALKRLWPEYSYAYISKVIGEIPALRHLRAALG